MLSFFRGVVVGIVEFVDEVILRSFVVEEIFERNKVVILL